MKITSLNSPVGEEPKASDRKPIWSRVSYVTEVYGLSQTKIYQLAKEGKITSVSLREQGQAKATRLFNVASVEAYIESFLESYTPTENAETNQ